jgi:predicted RNase H-like HicB family nuclease
MTGTAHRAFANLIIEFDRESDGRWIAEVRKLPGVLVYGRTKREAERNAKVLALRVIADMVEQGKAAAANSVQFAVA